MMYPIFSFLFLLPCIAISQTHSVSGGVVNAETGEPIPNANVFIARSMMGAATNEQGQFLIRNMPEGTFEILASVIGYEIEKQTIRVCTPFEKIIIFKLSPRVIPLQEVTISAEERKQWQEHLNRFTELLLSTTHNASMTRIENPLVLEFSETKSGTFIARAEKPLIIRNQSLGYLLTYYLHNFEATHDYVKYAGTPRFEELFPASDAEQAAWDENRRRAYLGSLRHFLTEICRCDSITHGDTSDVEFRFDLSDVVDGKAKIEYKKGAYLKKQGFDVLWMSNPWRGPRITQLVNTNKLLSPGPMPSERYLKFKNYLQVMFEKEPEEKNYPYLQSERGEPGYQVSWITLESDSVIIDARGRYFDTFKIKTSGYWAWERLADMLPLEYSYPE